MVFAGNSQTHKNKQATRITLDILLQTSDIVSMMNDTRKIIQALTYIAYQQPGHKINSMKAYKLLWLADRYHLRQYGRTITGDTFFALPKSLKS